MGPIFRSGRSAAPVLVLIGLTNKTENHRKTMNCWRKFGFYNPDRSEMAEVVMPISRAWV
jgi:hypothetical protein